MPSFWIQYLSNQPVKVETHHIGEQDRKWPLSDISDLVAAYRPNSLLANVPLELLTLHATVNGDALRPGLSLSLLTVGTADDNPLIIKSLNDTITMEEQTIHHEPVYVTAVSGSSTSTSIWKRPTLVEDANHSFAEHPSFKRQCIEISDLTTQLKSFANAQLIDGCIQSQNQELLPYPQDDITKLYVRTCYQDVFNLLMEQINCGSKSFAISGTLGIGKSLFFVYILYRLMENFCTKTLPLKPSRIVYYCAEQWICFDLEQQTVVQLEELDAGELVRKQDTFYIVDGQSYPLLASCIVLFISSPQSKQYKKFVNKKMAYEWFFPVWTLVELQTCWSHCYQDLPIEMLQERYRICGGVARSVFYKNYTILVPESIEEALADADKILMSFLGK